MNRLVHLVGVGFMLACLGTGCSKVASSGQPQVVINHYPQRIDRSVLQWDCPVFVAYRDGTIIWRKSWAPSVAALTATKSEKAALAAQKLTGLVRRLGGQTFVLTGSSDPEVTTIWAAGKSLTISGSWQNPRIYAAGDLGPGQDVERANAQEKELWQKLPSEIRDVLAEIAGFDDVAGKPWRPEKLRVTLQPPVKARGQIVPWPAQWAQSFAPVPGSQAMKSLELPGSMLDEVLRLFPSDGQARAVELAGETRYVSVRFVFPGEAAWKQTEQ